MQGFIYEQCLITASEPFLSHDGQSAGADPRAGEKEERRKP